MLVSIKVQVSGQRDGVAWPAPGETLEVSEDEAAQLIYSEIAVEYDEANPYVPPVAGPLTTGNSPIVAEVEG